MFKMENILLDNLNKIHTTILGERRIKNNLNIDYDVIKYCQNIIQNKETIIKRRGKNYYCECNKILIVINASSFTIITAHIEK